MSFYQHHAFFCTHHRDNKDCCQNHNASEIREYAKQRVKELGLHGKGRVRINNSGCLNRCGEGPVMVVYPEEVWYSYSSKKDIDEIIVEHLQHGRVVERLRI